MTSVYSHVVQCFPRPNTSEITNIDFENKDCKTYPGSSTETTVCFCNGEDLCNGAQNLISSNVFIALVMAFVLKFMA